ncbi:MAG: c-type cytochrome [Gammaproteobacteria bacterium]|nr:c-type cytochrome [Gammaproteobacteria bacterium]NNJ50665.1 c-type cytochrome [Gammaproteobacteria bacterium]
MKSAIQYAVFVLLCLTIPNTQAVEKITIKLDFIPNIEDGQTTYGVCARCHLPEAWGNDDGTYPQLAGQHVNVLMKQLLDIRNGTRHSSLMFPFVQSRTVGGYQELSNVVAYISTLPMNPDHSRGPWQKGSEQFEQGKEIYQKHCAACHGDNGEGNNELVYPRLQGQHFQYMNQQIMRIKNGVRQVHPAMQAVVSELEPEQLEQAINYASYFAVPKEDMASSKTWRNPDFN